MRKWIPIDCSDQEVMLARFIHLTGEYEQAIILTDQLEGQIASYKSLKSLELLAGFGALHQFDGAFSELSKEVAEKDWYLGFLSYDLKDELHPLPSHADAPRIDFPKLWFFRPQWLIKAAHGECLLGYDPQCDNEETARQFLQHMHSIQLQEATSHQKTELQPSVSESDYIRTVEAIQDHIHRGDIYEINFCMEFTAENSDIHPQQTFLSILKQTAMPFSAFVKKGRKYVLSASPERYLKKTGRQIVSMPMKGTAPRGADKEADSINLHKLTHSVKERAENIMITDLVRNDLSMVAQKGTVEVIELCGAYPFPHVFQVVSTVEATLKKEGDWADAIAATFPMGSMTGAPKHRAMQLIDRFENHQRGLFSGAIGYITPEKDFDFSVVIRTLLYDEAAKSLSYSAGSAITALSDPGQEYKECLLKAATVRNILAGTV
ncbi:anthranilate synthase component I family protein [Geofilum rubicundum]|uniref:Para-aminobenzoate synthase, aminase component n=1 Tax=Geofilum rubicundum JCM 15548 TaxID=1236989 RepID=A0A0E9LPU7_9BACT|nr:anthranilate synthase component I family protein [Geofilum rubicundum]GAO27617.1 para-aminobenzoate synthase, aminase component [Geofilum rubicundum JCM 15548]